MKVALLVVGTPRTFIIQEQINFFNELKNNIENDYELDIYIYLKLKDKNSEGNDYIQSEIGLNNFKKQINQLKPKFIKIIEILDYEYENEKFANKNQTTMINYLLDYIKEREYNYDWFIRIRPDYNFNLINFNFNFNKLNKNNVYSAIKCDAVGNDQFFYFSNHYINIFKNNIINYDKKLPPEYYIFNNTNIYQNKSIDGGLIRCYNKFICWDKRANQIKNKLFLYDYEKNKYQIKIDYNIFLERILNM